MRPQKARAVLRITPERHLHRAWQAYLVALAAKLRAKVKHETLKESLKICKRDLRSQQIPRKDYKELCNEMQDLLKIAKERYKASSIMEKETRRDFDIQRCADLLRAWRMRFGRRYDAVFSEASKEMFDAALKRGKIGRTDRAVLKRKIPIVFLRTPELEEEFDRATGVSKLDKITAEELMSGELPELKIDHRALAAIMEKINAAFAARAAERIRSDMKTKNKKLNYQFTVGALHADEVARLLKKELGGDIQIIVREPTEEVAGRLFRPLTALKREVNYWKYKQEKKKSGK